MKRATVCAPELFVCATCGARKFGAVDFAARPHPDVRAFPRFNWCAGVDMHPYAIVEVTA